MAREGTWYAHASVGTLHVRPILDMRRDGAAKMRAIAEEASAMVREYKGAYSGEHGDGLCRGEWVAWQFGPRLIGAFAEIKALFDPDNRMNPGKIVAPPRMDDARLFRVGAQVSAHRAATRSSTGRWNVERDPMTGREAAPGTGGDAGARPRQGGRDVQQQRPLPQVRRRHDVPELSRDARRAARDARARQHACGLRSCPGSSARDGLASDAVHDALELCVSCKGCKRECPTGVDMAKMKIEALAARRERHGPALRDRLVGYVPRYAPLVEPRRRAIANLRDRFPGTRRRCRSGCWDFPRGAALPRWHGDFLRVRAAVDEGGAQATDAGTKPPEREVLLFVDTFTNYFAGENALAARTCSKPRATQVHLNAVARRAAAVLWTHFSLSRSRRRSERRKRAARSMRCYRSRAAALRSSASSRPACSACATNFSTTASATTPRSWRVTR